MIKELILNYWATFFRPNLLRVQKSESLEEEGGSEALYSLPRQFGLN